MTEEAAHHYAQTFARSLGVKFYVTRSHATGNFLAVQDPTAAPCDVIAIYNPPKIEQHSLAEVLV